MGLFGNKSNEDSFINQQNTEANMEKKRTKEEAQQELIEKFGLRKTSDFISALQQGKVELAEEWLNFIIENKDSFPQYAATWNSWLSDRQKDIEVYKNLKNDGSLEKMKQRSKEEAQQELIEKFGMRKTSDFQLALKQGKIELAEEWLNYVINNKMSFPQYIPTWDSWLADRQNELTEAKA